MATHTSQRLVYYFSASILKCDKSLNPLTPTQDQRQPRCDEHGAWLRDCWGDRGRGRRRRRERERVGNSQREDLSSSHKASRLVTAVHIKRDKHTSLSRFQTFN